MNYSECQVLPQTKCKRAPQNFANIKNKCIKCQSSLVAFNSC